MLCGFKNTILFEFFKLASLSNVVSLVISKVILF